MFTLKRIFTPAGVKYIVLTEVMKRTSIQRITLSLQNASAQRAMPPLCNSDAHPAQ